jgi:hypothetical protein
VIISYPMRESFVSSLFVSFALLLSCIKCFLRCLPLYLTTLLLATTDEMRRKTCTVFPFHPWDPKEERREGVVLWVPQSIQELIKAAKEQLKCSSGTCILSENGGKILDINMVTNDQELYLVCDARIR